MKIFACILSIYVLALTAIPCIDLQYNNDMHKTELAQKSTSGQNDIDYCSPFCTCSCCASPIIYQGYSIHFNCFL